MSYKFRLLSFRPSRLLFDAACAVNAPWRIRERKHGRAAFAIGDGVETFRMA